MEYKYICVYLHTCIYTHIIHTIHCWLFFKQTKVGKPNNSYKRHTRLELFLWKNHTHTNANLHSIELPIRHWFISHIYINKYDITYYIPYSIQSTSVFCSDSDFSTESPRLGWLGWLFYEQRTTAKAMG